MIKVVSKIIPAADGLDLDTEVFVAAPKAAPKEVASLIVKAEIVALLKELYQSYPDMIEGAIGEFIEQIVEEAEHDKTDIDND